MDYCVFDLESTYGTFGNRVSSPFSNQTGLCSGGFKFGKMGYTDRYYVRDIDGINQGIYGKDAEIPDLSYCSLLIGHNIKFDLLWLWENEEIKRFIKRGGKIWDTAYAEYLLSAQFYNLHGGDSRGISLKQVAKRRKCTHQKLDIVASLWDDGYRTEDIPKEVLLEYQEYDVLTTEEIFLQQIKEAREKGMVACIQQRHEGMLATTEMEYNGLNINMETAREQQHALEESIISLTDELYQYLPELPENCEFKWSSWRNVSAFLFGGVLKYKDDVIVHDEDGNRQFYKKKVKVPKMQDGKPILFKSGKNKGKVKTVTETVPDIERGPKTRKETLEFHLPRQVEPKPIWKSSIEGYYQTGEDILEEVKEANNLVIVDKILDLKGKVKDLGTYYEKTAKNGNKKGMLTCIQDTGRIHGNLNHNITATTRLSSSKPNLQNISGKGKSEVKRVFDSRFGEDGVIVEIDYSQLEVVCKAVLAGDHVMLDAVLSGIDEHCEWLAFARELPYEQVKELCETDPEWKQERQNMKACTFGKFAELKTH